MTLYMGNTNNKHSIKTADTRVQIVMDRDYNDA